MEAVSFYLVSYFITTVGSFGILTYLSDKDRDAELLDDFKGLFWRRPWTATSLSAMLLSLAGIPLTAGFVGKFYVVAAGVSGNTWLLVIMLVVNSAIGLYYYIRIIAIMCDRENVHEQPSVTLKPSIYVISGFSVAVVTIALLWVGVFPAGLMDLIRSLLNP
jgi:NADH-quinone oxidoreductase subunit N